MRARLNKVHHRAKRAPDPEPAEREDSASNTLLYISVTLTPSFHAKRQTGSIYSTKGKIILDLKRIPLLVYSTDVKISLIDQLRILQNTLNIMTFNIR